MLSSTDNLLYSLPGYDIQEKLGEGGMGVVFKARDTKLERPVAIKFLYQDGDTNKATDQVLQEARRLAQVNHPNVVSIYELCETQTETKNRSAIVMEYLNGAPLADVNKEQLLSQTQKLSYLIQIAQGMVAIHEAGLRHGDLKAENVWITDDNVVKLLDFGLSAEIDSQQSSEAPCEYSSASLTTLSPEFCSGAPLTQQTDIFNFGCLACQLLTDKLPFNTSTQEATQQALCKGELSSASQLSPALSGALAQVLDHCLHPEPKKRPDNFARLYQELSAIEDALKQQQLANNATMVFEPLASAAKQPAETRQKPAVSPAQRNKLLAMFASIVLLATISVFVWHESNQPPPEKSVLVFPAKMTGEAEMPPEQIRMIKAALDNTLRDSVINTRSLNLISRSELDSVADDLNSSLKATGASNALQPLVDCQGASCQITIELINGSSALIENQVRWHSPALDVYEIRTLAQSYFQQLFPEHPTSDEEIVPVSKEAFEEFTRLYAELQFNAGNTDAHLTKLGELLEENPYLFSGYSLFRDTAIKLHNDTNNEEYLNKLEYLLLNSPDEYQKSSNYTRNLIFLRLEIDNKKELESLFEIAQNREIDNVSLMNLKGIYELENGRFNSAKLNFQNSLKSRFSVYTLYNLALTHWYLGELDDAIEKLNSLLQALPNYYRGTQLLALMHLIKGDINGAIKNYEVLVNESPENADLSNLGLAYLLQGNLEKALEYTERAFITNPTNKILMINLADIEKLSGLNERANDKYKSILESLLDEEDIDSLIIKAQAQAHTGDYIGASKSLSLASKLAPNNTEVAFISSLVFTLSGQYPSAIAKMEEALSSGTGVIWYNLPWFHDLCKIQEAKTILKNHHLTGTLPCNY